VRYLRSLSHQHLQAGAYYLKNLFDDLWLFRESWKSSGLCSSISDYYHKYEKSECRVRIKFSTAELLGIFIKIKPKETSTIILNNAITVKLCRKEFLPVLCLKIIIAAIEPTIPKMNVVAKSVFSGILKRPNLANNLSIP
jgi:hypothetical protein